MNIFEIAATNSTDLEQRLIKNRARLTSAEISAFDRFVQGVRDSSSIGINMRQTVLIAFITTSEYQNIHDWAESVSLISDQTADEILQQKLGSFYERRLCFDDSFENGRRFRYGLLIKSGVGAKKYGNYCSIFKRERLVDLDLAYLMRDSLTTYMMLGPALNETALAAEIAVDDCKHFLAGIKHCAQVVTTPEISWDSLLCSDNEYIEAIFTGTVSSNDLEEVRILKSDYDLYYYFAFENFREKLDEATRALIEGFAFIVKMLKARGVRLEVV